MTKIARILVNWLSQMFDFASDCSRDRSIGTRLLAVVLWLLYILLVVLHQLIMYPYFYAVKLIFRHTVRVGDTKIMDEKLQWCKNNHLKHYDFYNAFNRLEVNNYGYESRVRLLLLTKVDDLATIGFLSKSAAMAYRLRWE